MLECRKYTFYELSREMGLKDKQAMTRKLNRRGIKFNWTGQGKNSTIEILTNGNPFREYCIEKLDFASNSDFDNVARVYYHLMNDPNFSSIPVIEMEELICSYEEISLNRATISKHIQKLESKNLIARAGDTIHYFSYKSNRQQTTEEEYKKAWRMYFEIRDQTQDANWAMNMVITNFGGVPSKVIKLVQNAFYTEEINTLNDLTVREYERVITEFSQTHNRHNNIL